MTVVESKKFNIGDKVIAIRDTPTVPEGWIGYVLGTDTRWGYEVYAEGTTGPEAFFENELELLSVSKVTTTQEAEHTGGSVNYYKVHVAHPTTLAGPYDAEANDIIESLGLTFAEGNLFKAIWRMAADRNGKKKKGNNSVYDAEKLVFFAERVLVQEKAKDDTN
jgi:hypothetical protein